MKKKADVQEQYSRRNCLLIHGLTETKTEDTDEMVLDVINNKLNIELSQISIDNLLKDFEDFHDKKVIFAGDFNLIFDRNLESQIGETERSWSEATSYYCKIYTIQRQASCL